MIFFTKRLMVFRKLSLWCRMKYVLLYPTAGILAFLKTDMINHDRRRRRPTTTGQAGVAREVLDMPFLQKYR
jgi:hypothetical protein